MQYKIFNKINKYFRSYNPENAVGRLFLEKNLTVSIAESCTGGLISSKLTDVPGSSAYVKLNFITYSNESKVKILHVEPELIKNHGAVSEHVAKAMAEGVRKVSNTDIGLGITGIAGPAGGTPSKPVGLVYIGISNSDYTEVHKVNINPKFSRKTVKRRAASYALNFLKVFILHSY